jgi:death-on-curing protein
VTAWRWLRLDVLLAVHDRQIAEHGGLAGVPNLERIEAALARPQHLAAYGNPDAAALAAAYAFGLVHNHGFADGNKRVAWIAARLFLADNGYTLRFDPADAVRAMEALAAGTLSEEELVEWFRKRIYAR